MASNRATLYDAGHYRCGVCGDNGKRVVYLGAVDLWLCGNCALDQLLDDVLIVGLERPTCSNCGDEANEFYCSGCVPSEDHDYCHDECWSSECSDCGTDYHLEGLFCTTCLQDRIIDAASETSAVCGESGCRNEATEIYCEDCWNEVEQNLQRDPECQECGYDGTTWTYCHDCLGDLEARCDDCGERATESYCTSHGERFTLMSGHDKATLRATVIDSFTNSKPRISEDGTEVHDGDIIVRWEG